VTFLPVEIFFYDTISWSLSIRWRREHEKEAGATDRRHPYNVNLLMSRLVHTRLETYKLGGGGVGQW